MKRVTVVCLAPDREAAVDRLGDLGTVHVQPSRPPASERLDPLLRQRENTERAMAILAGRKPRRDTPAVTLPPAEVVAQTLARATQRSAAEDRRQKLLRTAQALAPWGSFRRESLEACRAAGLPVILAALNEEALPQWPAGTVVQELSREDKTVYLAIVAPPGVALDVPMATLPEITDQAEIQAGLEACEREVAEAEADLDRLTPALPALRDALAGTDAEIAFTRACEGMGAAGPLAYLEGYVPAHDVEGLLASARQHGWAIRSVDPAPDDANVPTKLRFPAWAEPVRTIFDILGILPGYREVDIGACFLLFFSVFFAMLIGDAGYGVILLALTLWARRRFRQAPAAPFWLFGVLSVCTILWGVLTGTYFAIRLPDGHPLRAIPSVSYFADTRNVQHLCFLLGAIHLTVAHVWNAWVTRPWLKAVGSLAWIPVLWGNYLLAKVMVLGAKGHPAMPWLYASGLVGVLLFTEPSRNPLKMVGMGLGKIVLNLANSFVDVVSYVRLFAVGAAGVKVAESMNDMALSMQGLPGWVGGLLMAVVLVLGHAFNLLLGSMGVLVHGVRLNVLEFAGHVGLEFSGSAYRPLQRRRAPSGD